MQISYEINTEYDEIHPYFRVVRNRSCTEIQRKEKRNRISEYAKTQGYELVEIMSETFESSVAKMRSKHTIYFVKSFHSIDIFDAELLALFHLRGARVPAIVDIYPDSLTICTSQVDGVPISGQTDIGSIFEFLAEAHSTGSRSLIEMASRSTDRNSPFQQYCKRHGLATDFSFCIGDHNPSNYLVSPSGFVSRIDLASFSIGLPFSLDLLMCFWNLFDVYDYYEPCADFLLQRYVNRRHQYQIETELVRIRAEMDVVTRFFDLRATTFSEHIAHLREYKLNRAFDTLPEASS